MKNIILAFSFLISVNALALESFCPEGDRNCTNVAPGGAGANAVGVENCPECSAFLKDNILLTESRPLPGSNGSAPASGGSTTNKSGITN